MTLASFAGCSNQSNSGDGGDGGDGGSGGGTTTSSSNGGGGSDTVQMDGFSVPADNVVSKSDLSSDRKIQTIGLYLEPPASLPDDYNAGKLYAQEAAKLGINFDVQTKTRSQMFSQIGPRQPPDGDASKWWDMLAWSFGADPVRLDPDALIFKVNHPSTMSGYNFNNYSNPEVTKLLDEQRAETDKTKRQALIKKFQAVKSPDAGDIMYVFPNLVIPWNQAKWDGIVNMKGIGPSNPLTFANATPKTNEREMVAILSASDQIRQFTPFTAGGTLPKVQMRMMYTRLTWPDENGLPQPRLATEINFTDDTTVEVPIRDHTFSDGKKVLAEDVKFSYDKNVEWNSKFAGQLAGIDSIEVADDTRAIFHLKRPFASIEMIAFAQINIVQKQHWENMMDTKAFKNAPRPDFFTPLDHDMEYVTSGLMNLDSVDKTKQVRLVKNPDHWDPIAYDSRLSRFVSSTSAAFNQLADGTADILLSFSGDSEALSKLVDQHDHLKSASTPSVTPRYLTMNCHKPPFHIPEFRHALQYRMPKEKVINGVFRGQGRAGHNTVISPALDFWYNGDMGLHQFALQPAADQLAKAGFVWDKEDGMLWLPEGENCVPDALVKPAEEQGLKRDSVKC